MKEIEIPEGYEARIEGNKVILEPKESENERVRQLLYSSIKNDIPIASPKNKELALSWLEKQKERKPTAEEVLIRAGLKPYKDGNQWCILVGDNIQEGICGFGDTIEDALYNFLIEVLDLHKEQKFTHHEVGESLEEAVTHQMEDDGDVDDFVRKGLDDVVLKYAKLGAEWQKDRVVKFDHDREQKPAEWSEEDKRNFYWISTTIQARHSMTLEYTQQVHKILSWLESRLRTQSHWKPSEGQIEALQYALGHGGRYDKGALESLLAELKKL